MAFGYRLGSYGRSVDTENIRAAILGGNEVYSVNANNSVVASVSHHCMLVIHHKQFLAARSRHEHTVSRTVNVFGIMEGIVVLVLLVRTKNAP
jgi:hypothetical protein